MLWVPFVVICVLGQPETCEQYDRKEQATPERAVCLAIARSMIPIVVFEYLSDHPGEATTGGADCEQWKGMQI